MANQNSIRELFEQLSSLAIMGLGRGPKHPTAPDTSISIEISKFLDDYPFLRKDPGYIEFLECYAGAGIEHPEEEFVVDLFGFTEVSSYFLALDESPLIDDNGFFAFCGGYAKMGEGDGFENVVTQGFLFDTTEERRWGIYRGSDDGNHYWYCETFQEWLQILVDNECKMPLHPNLKS